jgi:hypothetical protein
VTSVHGQADPGRDIAPGRKARRASAFGRADVVSLPGGAEVQHGRTVGSQVEMAGLMSRVEELCAYALRAAVQQMHEDVAHEAFRHLVLPQLDLLLQRAARSA